MECSSLNSLTVPVDVFRLHAILEDSPRPHDLVLFAGRLVGWNASGEFAAAFPTVSVHGDVVTA